MAALYSPWLADSNGIQHDVLQSSKNVCLLNNCLFTFYVPSSESTSIDALLCAEDNGTLCLLLYISLLDKKLKAKYYLNVSNDFFYILDHKNPKCWFRITMPIYTRRKLWEPHLSCIFGVSTRHRSQSPTGVIWSPLAVQAVQARHRRGGTLHSLHYLRNYWADSQTSSGVWYPRRRTNRWLKFTVPGATRVHDVTGQLKGKIFHHW